MKNILVGVLFVIVSSVAVAGAAQNPVDPEKSPINIAVGKRTPSLDGAINKFEYAFGGTGFFDLVGKTYSSMQSRYYLSYDDKCLYVGVVTPASQNSVVEKQDRDSSLWEDDSVEIHILPDCKKDEIYQFIFNSKGVYYDSKAGNATWNIKDIQVVSKVQDNQWTLEVAFPLSEFTPAISFEGNLWKINICRSCKENMLNTTIGPCNVGYSDVANFAAVRFARDLPAVNIASLGDLNCNVLDFKMDLMSAGQTEAILTLTSPKEVLPYYFEKAIKLSPATAETVVAQSSNLPPNNLLQVNLKLKTGADLYRATFDYKDQTALKISYLYTDSDKQMLNLVCSSSDQKITRNQNHLTVKMLDDNADVIMEQKLPIVSENLIFTLSFSIAELPPGEYKCVIDCVDNNGRNLLQHWEMYRKPVEKPSWSDTKAGISDKVPKPWTPIAATKKQFKCWGRVYSFNDSGLLSSIIAATRSKFKCIGKMCSFNKSGLLSSIKSQDVELLAGPIRLTVNGQDASETVCELVDANATTANYRLTSRAGDIKIDAGIKAEFDGFLWVNLDFSPASGAAEIKSMTMDIPLRRDFITGFDDCQSETKVDLTEKTDKTISKNFAIMPACWIGGDDVGLMIGAKNLKGWYVKNKDRSMEVIPGDKSVTVRLNLVDTPLKMTAGRRIGFYLEATPTRPRNPMVKSFRNELNITTWTGYWGDYFDYYNPKYLAWEKIKKIKEGQKSMKTVYYTSSHGTSPYSPEWNYYGKEWHSSPPALGAYCVDSDVSQRHLRDRSTFTYACLDCKLFFDYKLSTLSDAINNPDIGIENLYIDLSWPKMCGNETHGCAWTDEFGYKHSSFDIIGTREYYVRLYNVLKAKNPEAVVIMHIVCTRTPVDTFADLLVVGENFDRKVAQKESYYDVLNPTLMRVSYAARGKEQEIWFIPQFLRGFLLFRPERAKTWNPEKPPEAAHAVRHFLGYMVVHDLSFMHGIDTIKPAKQLYSAQDWLGWDADVHFFPYWKQDGNPAQILLPQSDRVMVSTFARNNKALVAILNDTDKPVDTELKIDTSSLFPKDKKNITGKNAFSEDNAVYEIKDNKLKVPMGPRDFKLLMFE